MAATLRTDYDLRPTSRLDFTRGNFKLHPTRRDLLRRIAQQRPSVRPLFLRTYDARLTRTS